MKISCITSLACLVTLILAVSSCQKSDQPSPALNGTYTGTSTPAGGAAYADTVVITGRAPYTQVSVQRTFHASNQYYTFYLPGIVSGNNVVIADTTIYFSPTPTVYSAKGSLADSVLTLHDSFTYQGGSTGTSTFVGVVRTY